MTTTTNRRAVRGAVIAGALAASVLGLTPPASANHPVTVEGNCFGPGAGMTASGLRTSPVPAGTCGDYDGDGNIGAAEDADGDNNYGSVNAALAAVAQNGRVLIVTSGVFGEVVTINPVDGGNVTLEAAPGVDANIDAVVQGDTRSGARQGAPGIIIDACARCRVTVRNVTSRNWTDGISIRGASHATLDQVRVDGNLNYGIRAVGNARVTISDSEVNGSGYRKNTAGVGTPNPGIGIEFEDGSTGALSKTTVSGSFGAGISGRFGSFSLSDTFFFDNNPNYLFTR